MSQVTDELEAIAERLYKDDYPWSAERIRRAAKRMQDMESLIVAYRLAYGEVSDD